MSYVFCNRCGHRNPPSSSFCSACGSVLDLVDDRTITLTKVDPLMDAPGSLDDVHVNLSDIPAGEAILVERGGDSEGNWFSLRTQVTTIGRHPESDIVLDDITVSRRHAQLVWIDGAYVVRDVGSLNGTYVNQQRTDETRLYHGDEVQIGKFRLVFFDRSE